MRVRVRGRVRVRVRVRVREWRGADVEGHHGEEGGGKLGRRVALG